MTIFFELLGAVALLLWGLRMVRTGVMRAYGPSLKKLARQAEGRVIPAFLSGLFVAVLLQSSAATAMIAATFSAQGIIGTMTAFLTILGADIGTALAVLVASQKITVISPALITIGVFGFLSTERSKFRAISRAILGLGLILLALSLISQTASSLTKLEGFVSVVSVFASQPFLMLLFGVVLSYLAHSSLAIVLLTTGFVATGFLNLEAGLYLILGANIGSGLLPVISNWNSKRGARQPVTANLLVRTLGVVLVYPFVDQIIANYGNLVSPALQPAIFHLVLNLAVAAVGLVFAKPFLAFAHSLLPEDLDNTSSIEPKYLDETALESPAKALACAKREALVMADIAQQMVNAVLPLIRDGDEQQINAIIDMDDSVDLLFDACKLYIAKIMQLELNAEESQRALELLSFTANMEHIGDIVDGSLMELATKKNKLQIQFSDEGLAEISDLHEAVCNTFDLAVNTFLTGESELAHQLFDAKADIRKIERNSVTTHLERIGLGHSDSLDTSGLHLDVVRDLKRINSHLTAIAYPVLKASGEVRKTKWKRKN
ncbi:MAG: Na/Pi cotransporter family protein [Rhizobiaceae bacterium]